MHLQPAVSCLQIPEILGLVLSTLSKCHLASTARVSRAWWEQAIQHLWAELDDILPLIDLFPADALSAGTPRAFVRPLSPQDFIRFNFYAPRVRELTFRERVSSVHDSVFPSLALHRPTLQLLPRLRVVNLRSSSSISLVHSTLFLNPKLSCLRLHMNAEINDVSIHTFFQTLAANSGGHLAQLCFSHGRPPHAVIPISNALLRLLPQLQSLTYVTLVLSVTTPQVFMTLAALPQLDFLKVSASKHSMADSEPLLMTSTSLNHLSLPYGPFPALKELNISAKIITCCSIIDSITSQDMRSIRLQVDTNSYNCFNIVAKHSRTLEAFVFENLDRVPPSNMQALVPLSTLSTTTIIPPPSDHNIVSFEALLTCRALRVLSIAQTNPIPLSDQLLSRMGDAWPLMESLSINPRPYILKDITPVSWSSVLHPSVIPAHQGVPMTALTQLVKKLPHLSHLGLLIDTTTFPVFPNVPVLSEALLTIDPGYSVLADDPGPVAFVLAACFPSVIVTSSEDGGGSKRSPNGTTDKWSQVGRLLDQLKAWRERDRKELFELRARVQHLERHLLHRITMGEGEGESVPMA